MNSFSASEASIRQLIANGKTKTALDSAKDVHKAYGTPASEGLLVDAYAARIQSLEEQGLKLEAKSLLDLVLSRFPSAAGRLAKLTDPASAVADLLAPLTDAGLPPETRAAIELRVEREIYDLTQVADCASLAVDHPLRQAAGALVKAFAAVTSGAVSEDQLALPEVSRRSPLAPWKLLVRAIGHFYRNEDVRAQECLDAIPVESAPARLLPAMRAMLGDKPAAPLATAATRLVSLTAGDTQALRTALEKLEQALDSDANDQQVVQASKAAVRECSLHAPARLDRLKQLVSVRCAMADIDKNKVNAAIGGGVRCDAEFFRLFARGMELTHDPENMTMACGLWDQFREEAVKEKWFSGNGVEAATLYLHMAGLLRRLPDDLLDALHASIRSKVKSAGELPYFLFPRMLYERACTLDPHTQAFCQWMEWAKGQRNGEAQQVAEAWHAILPGDIEPILFLMHDAANRNAFPTALKRLAKAELIDSVHPEVRRARLQLLVGSAIKHIQQKKPHLAEERLTEIAALPQSQQGDRPAFIAALHYLAARGRDDLEAVAAQRAEMERRLGGRIAASLLIYGVALAIKRAVFEPMQPTYRLDKADRASLPAAVARVVAVAADMNNMTLNIPFDYIRETAKQLRANSKTLDTVHLQTLAETGVSFNHAELAYAATAAGLERGGADARFLLLRAQLLHGGYADRKAVCAAAAAELARQHRDMQLVEEAVELTRTSFDPRGLTLTAEQAAEVVLKEKAAKRLPKHPGQGPSYRNLLPTLCPCPTCRAQRGEAVGPYDDLDEEDFDDELDEIFGQMPIPPDMPPAIARLLFQETKKAIANGESIDDLKSRLFGTMPGARKKGRRR